MTRHESRLTRGHEGEFVVNFNSELAKTAEMVDKGGKGRLLPLMGSIGIRDLISLSEFYVTFVYGFNKIEERVPLWNALTRLAVVDPWIVLGDFNNVMFYNEKIGLSDIKCTGAFFTWNNKQPSATRVFSRIDRVLVNDGWVNKWPDYYAHFAPEGDFDHCPCFINSEDTNVNKKNAFKFFNMWCRVPDFKELLRVSWSIPVPGTPMFRVVKKLKLLKPKLKELNSELFSDIEKNTDIAYGLMIEAQRQLQSDAGDKTLMDNEHNLRHSYHMLAQAKEDFLTQKAKCSWAKEGDANTAMFHKVIKQRQVKNKVLQIEDAMGKVCKNPEDIIQAFVGYHEDLLGTSTNTTGFYHPIVAKGKQVQSSEWSAINRIPTDEEIKNSLFSIPDDKSPGPDGYSSCFYKNGWETVKEDVCNAVKDFFQHGKLLKQINSTNLVLIPKVDNPISVKEFRPLACFNTIYKVISKLLCARMVDILPKIINPAQSSFINGRSIMSNILISQDLVRLYNRKSVSPRCMLKVDLRKAYDSIEWILCIKCKRGLRQGDPLSPLLFTLCMEYLGRLIEEISNEKSDIILNGLQPDIEAEILEHTGFKKGTLPFKYLGVQIYHKRLTKVDCNALADRMIKRIRGWNKRKISYSSRLILVKSMLATLHNCWAQIFILPAVVGKLVWWMVIKKDHLWIKWIDKIYMKGRAWYDYNPGTSSSWAWRKICEVKTRFKEACIDNKWLGKDEEYTITAGYDWLMQTTDVKVPWYTSVWNRFNVNKHSFIAWLIKHERLLTMDRLFKMGIITQTNCYLCGEDTENHEYLFVKCRNINQCYGKFMDWLNIRVHGDMTAERMIKLRKCSGFIRLVLCAMVTAIQYQVWNVRNLCRHEHYVISPSKILANVQHDCRLKLMQCKLENLKQGDITWCKHRDLSRVSIVEDNAVLPNGDSSNNKVYTPAQPVRLKKTMSLSQLFITKKTPGDRAWVRTVESDFTPKRGMFFLTLEDAVQFYNIYALACGFDVRRYTNAQYKGGVTVKSLVCNRQGYRDMKRKMRLEATNHEAGNLSTERTKTGELDTKEACDDKVWSKANMRLRTREKTG
ncbi:uncharacterized protein LOC141651642 [Silene latifolia]|uniref:uncharacterized protein LOC141651642 n=1 Tax=Silene latifolia TaxID=37657 RepID=UPI003D780237